jgi:hypothetical protein
MSDTSEPRDMSTSGKSARELDAMVEHYLDELAGASRALPRGARETLIEDIRQHVAARRAERPVHDRAGMEELLTTVGLPEDIAAAALEAADDVSAVDGSTDGAGTDRAAAVTNAVPGPRRWRTRALVAGGVATVLAGWVAYLATVDLGRGPLSSTATAPPTSTGTARVYNVTKIPPRFLPNLVPISATVLPDVVGLFLPQAEATLDAADYSFSVTYVRSVSPAGQVVGTNPSAGAIMPEGSRVQLRVSSGPTQPAPGTAPA